MHLNLFTGSRVTAIWVNGGILTTRGGVKLGRVVPAACAAGLLIIVSDCVGHPCTKCCQTQPILFELHQNN